MKAYHQNRFLNPQKTQIQTLLASGLADLSLREVLGTLLSGLSVAERDLHLEHRPDDRPNGFYDRSLQVGSVPIDIRVPRTRNGDFRPANLPSPYQRGYPEEVESILLGLLASSRSVNAAREALQKMGLSGSQQDLERVASGLIEELDLGNSRPLDTDLLAYSWMASTSNSATATGCVRPVSTWWWV